MSHSHFLRGLVNSIKLSKKRNRRETEDSLASNDVTASWNKIYVLYWGNRPIQSFSASEELSRNVGTGYQPDREELVDSSLERWYWHHLR
jgi:hypothetical protein